MALITLRAADEVRASQFDNSEGELDAEMVAIARAIIAQRTGSFDPTTYRDRYQELTGKSLYECPACRRGHMVRVAILAPITGSYPVRIDDS